MGMMNPHADFSLMEAFSTDFRKIFLLCNRVSLWSLAETCASHNKDKEVKAPLPKFTKHEPRHIWNRRTKGAKFFSVWARPCSGPGWRQPWHPPALRLNQYRTLLMLQSLLLWRGFLHPVLLQTFASYQRSPITSKIIWEYLQVFSKICLKS